MTWNYNVTGPKRKELAAAVGAILGVKPKYLGMPTAAYEIGGFTVTREGALQFDDSADSEKAGQVLAALAQAGFLCGETPTLAAETTDTAKEPEAANNPTETEIAPQGENLGLTVEVPLDQVNVGNLTRLLDAKGSLFKKALGVDSLPRSQVQNVGKRQGRFPYWFKVCPYFLYLLEFVRFPVQNLRLAF